MTPQFFIEGAREALLPAFDRSSVHDVDDWLQRCKDDLAQVWNLDGLWAITEVQNTRQGLALHIVAMAGNFSHDKLALIEGWGKSVGCNRAFFTGRKGWLRRVPYRLRTVTAEKEL